MIATTVVAFYGPKPAALGAFLGAAQQALGAALGTAFQRRPVDDVHATIIGLEDAPECADDVAAFIGATLRGAPLELQFGGFADAEAACSAAGVSLYERSAVLGGGRAVVIGWPVEHGRPTVRLGSCVATVRASASSTSTTGERPRSIPTPTWWSAGSNPISIRRPLRTRNGWFGPRPSNDRRGSG